MGLGSTSVEVSRAFIKPARVKRPPFVGGQHKQFPAGARSVGCETKKALGGERGAPVGALAGQPGAPRPEGARPDWRTLTQARTHTHARKHAYARTDVTVRHAEPAAGLERSAFCFQKAPLILN